MTRAALGFTTISVYVSVRSLLWYILLSTCCRFSLVFFSILGFVVLYFRILLWDFCKDFQG